MKQTPKVAIVTGAERGIGAGLATAFRHAGYAVVATSRTIPAADEPNFLAVQGDIADPDTARRVVEQALDRFGRIDSLINNAGIYIGKPFTDYTLDDYAAITAVNLTGFFHITQRVIRADGRPGQRPYRQHQHQPRRPRRQHETFRAGLPHQGGTRRRRPLAGDRVRLTRRTGERGFARSDPDPDAGRRVL